MKVTIEYFDDKLLKYDIDCKNVDINVEYDFIHILHNDNSDEWLNFNKLFSVRKYK